MAVRKSAPPTEAAIAAMDARMRNLLMLERAAGGSPTGQTLPAGNENNARLFRADEEHKFVRGRSSAKSRVFCFEHGHAILKYADRACHILREQHLWDVLRCNWRPKLEP